MFPQSLVKDLALGHADLGLRLSAGSGQNLSQISPYAAENYSKNRFWKNQPQLLSNMSKSPSVELDLFVFKI